jgi:hypothetical protein
MPARFVHLKAEKGLRHLLAEKQRAVRAFSGDARDLFVIIRPQPECSYQVLIDVIDEMTINEITRYTIID